VVWWHPLVFIEGEIHQVARNTVRAIWPDIHDRSHCAFALGFLSGRVHHVDAFDSSGVLPARHHYLHHIAILKLLVHLLSLLEVSMFRSGRPACPPQQAMTAHRRYECGTIFLRTSCPDYTGGWPNPASDR